MSQRERIYCCFSLDRWQRIKMVDISRKKSWLGVPGWPSWLIVWLLISVQVMISRFMGLSPALGSALAVQRLLGILSLCLSPAHMCAHSFSPAPQKLNKQTIKKKERRVGFTIRKHLLSQRGKTEEATLLVMKGLSESESINYQLT